MFKADIKEEFDPVEIDQMFEVLSIVPGGISIAFIFIIFEILLKNKFFLRKFLRRNKKYKTQFCKIRNRRRLWMNEIPFL